MVQLRSHRWKSDAGLAVLTCAAWWICASVEASQGTVPAKPTGQDQAGVLGCIQQAARQYGISAELLLAIARHESGLNPNAVNRANVNGSVDVGLLQINSGWFSTLKRFGISPSMLWDPCTNATVGAWILAQNIQRHGYTWKAVGAYNASSPHKQQAYAQQIHRVLRGQQSAAIKTVSSEITPTQIRSNRIAAAEFDSGVTHD